MTYTQRRHSQTLAEWKDLLVHLAFAPLLVQREELQKQGVAQWFIRQYC